MLHNWGDKEREMNEKPSPRRMLMVQEVADLLGVHPKSVRRWSDRGLLKTYRVGPRRDRTFELADVNSFLSYWSRSQDRGEGAVLIVDRDPKIRRILKDITEGQGYKAVAVETGETAQEELEKQHFDLIFLELALAGLSGVDVLRVIKAKDRKGVVVVMGYGDERIALEAMSLRTFVFIRKPFDMTDIIQVLHAFRPNG